MWTHMHRVSVDPLGAHQPPQTAMIHVKGFKVFLHPWILSTKASRQSTLGYTHGSSLSADTCTSYELDGDARHRQGFYLGSAAMWA